MEFKRIAMHKYFWRSLIIIGLLGVIYQINGYIAIGPDITSHYGKIDNIILLTLLVLFCISLLCGYLAQQYSKAKNNNNKADRKYSLAVLGILALCILAATYGVYALLHKVGGLQFITRYWGDFLLVFIFTIVGGIIQHFLYYKRHH